MPPAVQIERKPGHKKIQIVVDRRLSDAGAPCRSVAQDIEITRSAHCNPGRSRRRRWPPRPPQRKPQEPEQSQCDEKRSPSKAVHGGATDQDAERGTERQPAHQHGICKSPTVLPEMTAQHFAVRGKGHRLPESENHPDGQQGREPMKKPAANTHRTSNRSTSQPAGICMRAYVQKNADSRVPSCDAEMPNSSLSSGAAIDRLLRST